MTDPYDAPRALPRARRTPVLVVMLHRLDRRQRGGGRRRWRVLEAETAAPHRSPRFDGDTFIDYRARRPTMELRDGVNTDLVWPTIELQGRPRRRRPRRAAPHAATSPTRRGSASPTRSPTLAVELGARMMVGLGAYPFADAAHPAAAPVEPASAVGRASPPALRYLKNSVDVPAGMEAVARARASPQGACPPLGLVGAGARTTWRRCRYPAATVALLDGLQRRRRHPRRRRRRPQRGAAPAPAARRAGRRQRRARRRWSPARAAPTTRRRRERRRVGRWRPGRRPAVRRRAGRRARAVPARPRRGLTAPAASGTVAGP